MNIWKPWYLHRPSQLLRRLSRAFFRTPSAPRVVMTPWGCEVEVDPRDMIGLALWTTGIYDLAVSEALCRLAKPGRLHLDIGANIGYMTGLLATRAGPTGRVFAYEPHPLVGERLRRNLDRVAADPSRAPVTFFPLAVSDIAGEGRLLNPTGFDANAGLARLATPDEPGGAAVATARLDDLLAEETVEVAKIDVEGYEAAVLGGAGRVLAGKRLRHIVFEEHGPPDAASFRLLSGHGYTVFQLGWSFSRLVLADLCGPRLCKSYEAANYLATTDPDAVRAAFAPSGFSCLTNRAFP